MEVAPTCARLSSADRNPEFCLPRHIRLLPSFLKTFKDVSMLEGLAVFRTRRGDDWTTQPQANCPDLDASRVGIGYSCKWNCHPKSGSRN